MIRRPPRSTLFPYNDALPILYVIGFWVRSSGKLKTRNGLPCGRGPSGTKSRLRSVKASALLPRSEEHTSELQSQSNLVCRLLLEKKKQITQLYYDSLLLLARD